MAWSVELAAGSPQTVTIKGTDYCKWCFTISRDDKEFLPDKIGLDFAYSDGTKKPEIITGESGDDFKSDAQVKESHKEIGKQKSDNKDRQIIWRNVPNRQKTIDLCFLTKGRCGTPGECLVSLERFSNDVWTAFEYGSGEEGDKKDKTKRRKIKGPIF